MVRRRIVLVGATGAFGSRLAGLLARWPDADLLLAARHAGALAQLRNTLAADHPMAALSTVVLDRDAPHALAELRPWAVVDAAGPFQASDLALARAAIAAGAHYLDISDARDFVGAFPAALDAEARTAGVLAVTGASSTPALSHAALDHLTAGWTRIDRIEAAISPGARAPRGLSVVQAILSYVGRPVRVFEQGRWQAKPGWSGPTRVRFPGLGRRWASLCETPDLDLFVGRFSPHVSAVFRAGLELAPLHMGLWLLSWLVRLRLAQSLTPLAAVLRWAAGLAAPLGSDRGGMVVSAWGADAQGRDGHARWSLVAEANAGPTVPVAAAAAVLRGLAEGRIATSGARACVGLVSLADILSELSGLPIRTRSEAFPTRAAGLFEAVMGAAFALQPPAVRRVHGGSGTFQGRGRARGARSPVVRLIRGVLGLPSPGSYRDLSVSISATGVRERWTRRFGRTAFTSVLSAGQEPGVFEERFGPVSFAFEVDPRTTGFSWRLVGWRVGPLALPPGLAPRIRARAFEREGIYRFSVATAHPLLGLLFAYAGRLG